MLTCHLKCHPSASAPPVIRWSVKGLSLCTAHLSTLVHSKEHGFVHCKEHVGLHCNQCSISNAHLSPQMPPLPSSAWAPPAIGRLRWPCVYLPLGSPECTERMAGLQWVMASKAKNATNILRVTGKWVGKWRDRYVVSFTQADTRMHRLCQNARGRIC